MRPVDPISLTHLFCTLPQPRLRALASRDTRRCAICDDFFGWCAARTLSVVVSASLSVEVLTVLRSYWQAADRGRVPYDTRPLADLPAVAGHDKRTPLLQPISPKTVERIVEGYVNGLGISEHVTPHSFRHGFATVLVENDVNLLLVKELLGHANISTTQVYTRLDFQHLAKAYDAAHPRARLSRGKT